MIDQMTNQEVLTLQYIRYYYLEAYGMVYKELEDGTWQIVFGETVASLRKQIRSGTKFIFVPIN